MITGPKYKKARRLGAFLFDKTMTQKFANSEARRGKPKDAKHPKKTTDYGLQMLEKQKARFMYGINERQFSKYVREAMTQKEVKPQDALFARLETRLDNAAYRLGLVPTRQAARQLASHCHLMVNGQKQSVPSYQLSIGDKITIRPKSLKSGVFATLDERLKTMTAPSWLKFDAAKKEAEVQGMPHADANVPFSLAQIIEFYSR